MRQRYVKVFLRSVPLDLTQTRALFHYVRAAELGNADAAANVGLFYSKGKAVSPDPARSFEWYMRAAKGGSSRGQFVVGAMFEKGRHVSRDITNAVWNSTSFADCADFVVPEISACWKCESDERSRDHFVEWSRSSKGLMCF